MPVVIRSFSFGRRSTTRFRKRRALAHCADDLAVGERAHHRVLIGESIALDGDLDAAAPDRRPVRHVERDALVIIENAEPHRHLLRLSPREVSCSPSPRPRARIPAAPRSSIPPGGAINAAILGFWYFSYGRAGSVKSAYKVQDVLANLRLCDREFGDSRVRCGQCGIGAGGIMRLRLPRYFWRPVAGGRRVCGGATMPRRSGNGRRSADRRTRTVAIERIFGWPFWSRHERHSLGVGWIHPLFRLRDTKAGRTIGSPGCSSAIACGPVGHARRANGETPDCPHGYIQAPRA